MHNIYKIDISGVHEREEVESNTSLNMGRTSESLIYNVYNMLNLLRIKKYKNWFSQNIDKGRL